LEGRLENQEGDKEEEEEEEKASNQSPFGHMP